MIDRITLINSDAKESLRDWEVHVGESADPTKNAKCGKGSKGIAAVGNHSVSCPGAKGRYVSVHVLAKAMLSLCEVQVFAKSASCVPSLFVSTHKAVVKAAPKCAGNSNGVLPGKFLCGCSAGYSGSTCTTDVDECASSPCVNGGACTDSRVLQQPMVRTGAFKCACKNGFSGGRCEADRDECLSSPCRNGATCSTLSFGSYSCACAKGWFGKNCEKDVDECAAKPCVAGRTVACSDSTSDKSVAVGGFVCKCK